MHTAEPLGPERSSFEVEFAIEKLERYKSPAIDEIPRELIQAGENISRPKIYKFINSNWNVEEMPQQGKESIKKDGKTGCNSYKDT
jgi:hypothetical protein